MACNAESKSSADGSGAERQRLGPDGSCRFSVGGCWGLRLACLHSHDCADLEVYATGAGNYEDHPESVELWSAGSSLFPAGPPDGKEEMPEGLADLNVEKIIKTLERPESMGSVHAG